MKCLVRGKAITNRKTAPMPLHRENERVRANFHLSPRGGRGSAFGTPATHVTVSLSWGGMQILTGDDQREV